MGRDTPLLDGRTLFGIAGLSLALSILLRLTGHRRAAALTRAVSTVAVIAASFARDSGEVVPFDSEG